MLENLSTRLQGIFSGLRGKGRLTEDDINDAMREIRMALLEADVNFKVVKSFVRPCSWPATCTAPPRPTSWKPSAARSACACTAATARIR